MTKRNSGKFRRKKQDNYRTPPEAVEPLLCVQKPVKFIEPCAGEGYLTRTLSDNGFECLGEADIGSSSYDILLNDATEQVPFINRKPTQKHETIFYITNPPWTRHLLHPILWNLMAELPTWILIDADWMHTKQSAPFMKHCETIVSVGRVSWMGNNVSGFDNAVWMLFVKDTAFLTRFIGR